MGIKKNESWERPLFCKGKIVTFLWEKQYNLINGKHNKLCIRIITNRII